MRTKSIYPLMIVAAAMSLFTACQKADVNGVKTTDDAAISATAASAGAIAVASVNSLALNGVTELSKDSIYVLNCFGHDNKKDTVAAASLSVAITTYLNDNYAGYAFTKAYKISDKTGAVINYIVVIKYNNAPVGLKFTAAGAFVSVLEQRTGADLKGGRGWHPGGPFQIRGGARPDTIALTAIPAVIKTTFTTAYPTDTLLHAGIAHDGNFILISKNNGLFATAISATGVQIKRMQINSVHGKHTAVTQASLPATITTYLSTTYPAYVFDKAFAASKNNVIQEYDVFITANNTKYVLRFNASGAFVKALPVR